MDDDHEAAQLDELGSVQSSLRVLVVEDDRVDQKSLERELKIGLPAGSTVRFAPSLSDAVELLAEFAPSVILLDLMLPDAGGFETIKRMRAHAPTTPLVALTRFEGELLAGQALEAGADCYVAKQRLEEGLIGPLIEVIIARAEMAHVLESRDRHYQRQVDQFRTLVDLHPDGALIVGTNGIVRYMNKAAERLIGRTSAEMVGHDFGLPAGEEDISRVEIPDPKGGFRIAEMRSLLVEWGGAEANLVTLHDLSAQARLLAERSELQHSLQQIQGLREDFLNQVAHELNTPLTPIMSELALLRALARDDPESPHAKHLGTLDEHIRRLGSLVETVVDYVGLQSGKLVCERRTLAVDDILEAVRGRDGPRPAIMVTEEAQAARVVGDVRLLQRVLRLLLDHTIRDPHGRADSAIIVEIDGPDAGDELAIRLQVPAEVARPVVLAAFDQVYDKDGDHAKGLVDGLGVGPRLASGIIDLHEGRLHTTKRSRHGGHSAEASGQSDPQNADLVFTVVLPLQRDDA